MVEYKEFFGKIYYIPPKHESDIWIQIKYYKDVVNAYEQHIEMLHNKSHITEEIENNIKYYQEFKLKIIDDFHNEWKMYQING